MIKLRNSSFFFSRTNTAEVDRVVEHDEKLKINHAQFKEGGWWKNCEMEKNKREMKNFI